jgi:putative DNA primase/helicase
MQGLPISGAAIRLTPASQVLGIAEGIETALSVMELFEVPCWSCVSAGGIESFEPPPGVKEVLIFGDNDLSYTGQAAAYLAAKRLRLKGYETEVHIPDAVGDWLDVLQARKVEEIPKPPPTPDNAPQAPGASLAPTHNRKASHD